MITNIKSIIHEVQLSVTISGKSADTVNQFRISVPIAITGKSTDTVSHHNKQQVYKISNYDTCNMSGSVNEFLLVSYHNNW